MKEDEIQEQLKELIEILENQVKNGSNDLTELGKKLKNFKETQNDKK